MKIFHPALEFIGLTAALTVLAPDDALIMIRTANAVRMRALA